MADRYTIGFDGDRHKGEKIGTLWNSKDDIDGDITLSCNFDGLSSIAKLDLLGDWIALLEREREYLLEVFYKK